jgi:predicted ester cyclase
VLRRSGLAGAKWNDEEGAVMASITEIAMRFFTACEAGQGWEGCKAFCRPEATFAAQAEPLAELTTLAQYTDWMKGLMTTLPDGRYEVKSFATDDARQNVCAFGVFSGTHLGAGGPCPPTGKSAHTDYVYVMDFDGDKIRHMTKIWHAGLAMKDLGWA